MTKHWITQLQSLLKDAALLAYVPLLFSGTEEPHRVKFLFIRLKP